MHVTLANTLSNLYAAATDQGVLATYIDMTGKKVDKATELQVCFGVQYVGSYRRDMMQPHHACMLQATTYYVYTCIASARVRVRHFGSRWVPGYPKPQTLGGRAVW